MKKTLILLLAALTILSLASCTTHADEVDRVTQPITQTDATVQPDTQTAASVQVQTPAPDSTPEPLPAAGDAVAFATPAPVPAADADPLSGEITVEAAQAIALAHAGLKESDVTYVRTERDHDDGCWKYEIEFICSNHEYDYDIDACTGSILSFDTELEHHHSEHRGDHHDNSAPAATAAPQSGELLTESEIKSIALAHAGLTEADVRFSKVQLDKDSRTWEYDVEFRAGRTEYEYEIDAYTGDIRDYDKDYDD